MGFSLALRRLYSKKLRLYNRPTTAALLFFHLKPFCSLQATTSPSDPPSKPTSLSARLSFVFDQIDAIERERSQKNETLQRIRAWQESNKATEETSTVPSSAGGLNNRNAVESIQPDSAESESKKGEKTANGLAAKLELQLVHPWPEWIELMERLVQQNYFDHRRKDEDKMVEDLGFKVSEAADEGFDFTRDWKTVQTAVLNFGRDRFDILRSLPRQDIQILVGYGCPSADKKVVFSAKLLRKHVHLDEGDVCSSCSLRGSCEKAYLLTNKEDEARTIDVMRVLLTYGFNPVNGSVVNKSLLKIKSVRTVVRKLLHEVVRLSAVPIDPNLSPPVIKRPPPKVKQPPPPKKRVGRDDIEMKKGDWLCPKCDFMNFAKNTICLQCDAKPPKRQLLPGEWECPQCNFLNYRRNVVCFHCEHKRPPDEFTENQMRERQQGLRMRPEKISNRADISNAWNFNFDDDESDGADVAAFEHADSEKLDKDFPFDRHAEGENRLPGLHERGYSDHAPKKAGIGFDDFDDDEDDIESYELDTPNNNKVRKDSSIGFSELEADSEFEDIEGTHNNWPARQSTSSSAHNKPSKPMRWKAALAEDNELEFESDEELPVRPNRTSSKFAGSRQRIGRRGAATNLGSDDDLGLSSGAEDNVDVDFGSWQKKGNIWGKSGLESDNDDPSSCGNRSRGNRSGKNRNSVRGPGNSNGGNRGKSFGDNISRLNGGSQSNGRGYRGDEYGRKLSNRGSNLQNFRNLRQRGINNHEHRTPNNFDNRSDSYPDDDRYRRPRVNVR